MLSFRHFAMIMMHFLSDDWAWLADSICQKTTDWEGVHSNFSYIYDPFQIECKILKGKNIVNKEEKSVDLTKLDPGYFVA